MRYEEYMKNGLDVDISTVAEMIGICKDLGLDSVQYLGEVDTSAARESVYGEMYLTK